jgi:hypothetical protein
MAKLLPALAGIALLLVMFLPWFGPSEALERSFDEARQITEQFGGPPVVMPDVDQNAWEAFGLVDFVLAAAAVSGIALTAARLMAAPPVSRLRASALATAVGIVATALVLYRVVDPVEDSGREPGLFLGLVASAGVAYGGWLALRDEERRVGARPRELNRSAARRSGGRSLRRARSRSSSD